MARGVQRLPSGKYRARITVDGVLESLPVCDTEEEAVALRAATLRKLVEKTKEDVPGVVTLKQWGETFLQRREAAGIRNVKDERLRWKRHVLTASFADWPVNTIRRRDVLEWIRKLERTPAAPGFGKGSTRAAPGKAAVAVGTTTERFISKQTVKHVKNLFSASLDMAVDEELVLANIAHGVKLSRELRTSEPWTYFEPHEQKALLECEGIPEPERLLIGWQLGTGLRPSETASLHLADLHVEGPAPHAIVRFGKAGKPPKNGKIRRVELFGVALDAVRRWLELLPEFAPWNRKGLVFPSARGARRQDGQLIRHWHKYLVAAGVRRARIYDLRHSCASSMVAGWWGRRWKLEEIMAALGHSSIIVTQRYAHVGETALRTAAAETQAALHAGLAKVSTPWQKPAGSTTPTGSAA